MTTNPVNSNSNANSATNSSINNGLASIANNYQTFLSLLTTQLANQDPLSPMDSSQFTQQLTQMTGVEQQLLSNQLLQQLVNQSSGDLESAVGLIGKTVTVNGDVSTLSGGSASWAYSLASAPANVTVSVLDSNNNIVWTGPVPVNGSGVQTFTWNGKNPSGVQQQDGGSYTLSVNATDSTGQKIAVSTTLQGTATAVQTVNGQTMVTIGGAQVPMSSVTGVANPSN